MIVTPEDELVRASLRFAEARSEYENNQITLDQLSEAEENLVEAADKYRKALFA